SPPHRTQGVDFPRYAHLLASPQALCDLSCWGDFRPRPANLVAIEQPIGVVQPPPTPPRPTEAHALPSVHQMAPDLLFHPVGNYGQARAGSPDRELSAPPARQELYVIDRWLHGLGSSAAELSLACPPQCCSLLELRRLLRTSYTRLTTDAAKIQA